MGNYVLIKVANFPEDAIIERVTISAGIRIIVEGTEGGTVSGGGRYAEGAQATLVATANTGYVLSHWTKNGVLIGITSSLQIVVDEPAIYKAVFVVATNVFNPLTARRNIGYNANGQIIDPLVGFIMSDYIDISDAKKIVWSGFTFIGDSAGAGILANSTDDTSGVRERVSELGNTVNGEYILTETQKQQYLYAALCVFRQSTGSSSQKQAAAENADLSGVKIYVV